MKRQTSSRSIVWAGLFVLLLYGCVEEREYLRFKGDVQKELEVNKNATQVLKTDVRYLNQMFEDYKARQEESEMDQKKHLANLSATVDEMQLEVEKLSSRLKEKMRASDSSSEAVKKVGTRLSEQIASLERRIGEVESRLGLAERGPVSKGAPIRELVSPSSPKPSEVPVAKPAPQVPEVKNEWQIYNVAKAKFDEGVYDQSREDFKKFLSNFPNSKLADNAQFWIGECYFKEGKYKDAILQYQKVFDNYPKGDKVPSALLKQGMAFQRLKDVESAKFLLQKVIKDYPDSDQAEKARKTLDRIEKG